MNTHRFFDWITLNIVNTVYLIKEWVLLQLGVQVGTVGMVDKTIGWSIGITIIVFNIVRILKYIKEINDKD